MSVTEAPAGPVPTTTSGAATSGDRRLSLFVVLFLLSIIVPLFFYAGPVRLSLYRLLLLVSFVPALMFLLSGKAGRIVWSDICVLVICVWSTVSLVVHHGVGPVVEPVGTLVLETMGAYLLGRCYIRSPQDLRAAVQILFFVCLLLAPFAVIEAVTDRNIPLEIARKLGPSVGEVIMDQRFGLNRVQGPFEHPILFGVLFGGSVGMMYFILGYGRPWIGRFGRMVFVGAVGALALSTGPLMALMTQIYFLIWNTALQTVKARWKILTALAILGYIVVDIISNRTPFHVLVTYMSFSTGSAYNRILIWQFGTDNIWANPVFGLGLNDWERPRWMSSSVDMFWIVGAMKHGIVVWVAYLTMFGYVFLSIARRKNLSEKMEVYRLGYLASMFGFFMAGWTVHFWNSLFVVFMFLVGAGLWMRDYQEEDATAEAAVSEQKRGQRFSRFVREAAPDHGARAQGGIYQRPSRRD